MDVSTLDGIMQFVRAVVTISTADTVSACLRS